MKRLNLTICVFGLILSGRLTATELFFQEPIKTPGIPTDSWGACLTPDGQRMVFTGGIPNQIYTADYLPQEKRWSNIQHLDLGGGSWQGRTSMTLDGQWLFYCGSEGGPSSQWYRSQRLPDGTWSPGVRIPFAEAQYLLEVFYDAVRSRLYYSVRHGLSDLDLAWVGYDISTNTIVGDENLLTSVNASGHDDSWPRVFFGGGILLFTSNRPGSLGPADIWMSTWNDAVGDWNPPSNPGPPLNTPGGDGSPWYCESARKLYYGRSEPLGASEIWEATVKPEWPFGKIAYQTDFSTDPGWTTDQPANYYWDAASQTYHIQPEHHYPGYQPSRYAYKLLDEPVAGSFELQWDIKPTRCDWSIGIYFGIRDENLRLGSHDIQAVFGNPDGGHMYGAGANGACGPAYQDTYVGWAVQWYTCKLTYDAGTTMMTFDIRDRGSASNIWTCTMPVPCGLTNDLKYLGTSSGGIGDNGTYPGINPWAVAEAYIDNVVLYTVGAKPQNVYHVDAVNGNDNNNGLTPETAFATIQKGVDTARDGDTILVWPAVYQEEVVFDRKAITVQSAADAAVVVAPSGWAFSFYAGEQGDSVLRNFVIRDSEYGIFCDGNVSPIISNLTIVRNLFGIAAYEGANPTIENCILWDNTIGDLFGCRARYSCIQRPAPEDVYYDNISSNPLFADPNARDYHLRSTSGRYWPQHHVWVIDDVTSPCIDAGDPNILPARERMPNGGRLNMGAYGGTPFASMSETKWLDGDINHDGVVNLIDLAMLAENWLRTGIGLELPANYNWLSYNGHHYALTLQYGTWEQAEAEAVSVGGHLVTTNDAQESAWLASTFNSQLVQELLWIGLYQLPGSPEPAEGWVWISGEVVTYIGWGGIEPNNLNDEDYGTLRTDGGWNDWGPTSLDYRPARGIIELLW